MLPSRVLCPSFRLKSVIDRAEHSPRSGSLRQEKLPAHEGYPALESVPNLLCYRSIASSSLAPSRKILLVNSVGTVHNRAMFTV